MPSPQASKTLRLRVVGLLLSLCAGLYALSLWRQLLDVSPAGEAPRPDLAPLFLGAWALWKHLDPSDPAVQQALWDRLGSGVRPGAFFMPYPTTAAALAMPLCYLTWAQLAQPVWRVCALSLGLGGAIAGLGRRTRWSERAAGAGRGMLAVLGLEVCAHSLQIGQINPLIVGMTLAAAALLAWGWDRGAGVLLGIGACIKLFPALLLLPIVLTRRWRALGATLATVLAVMVLTYTLFPAWSPLADLGRAWEQATIGQATEHPPMWGLWRYRGLVVGLGTLGLSVWVSWRRRDPEALDALIGLVLAWGAVEAGGMSPPHEMLLAAPALAWLAATPPQGRPLALLFALIATFSALSPLDHYPGGERMRFSQDHALPLILLIWAAAALRALTLPAPDPPDVVVESRA